MGMTHQSGQQPPGKGLFSTSYFPFPQATKVPRWLKNHYPQPPRREKSSSFNPAQKFHDISQQKPLNSNTLPPENMNEVHSCKKILQITQACKLLRMVKVKGSRARVKAQQAKARPPLRPPRRSLLAPRDAPQCPKVGSIRIKE